MMPRSAPLPLVVCADDFGLNRQVNAAVIELAVAGRLSATSCLVDGPAIADGAQRLCHPSRLAMDVGLHFNLTEDFGGRSPRWTLPQLIGRAYAGVLNLGTVRMEVRRQLDLFEQLFNASPDHVDGHQHVHQLPGVRQVLLGELRARYPGRPPWLRSGRTPSGIASLKPAIVSLLGSRSFSFEAAEHGFDTNRRLLGVYGFHASSEQYTTQLGRWLDEARPWDLLMCHPALGNDPRDPITEARWMEYGVLAASGFEQMLQQRGIVLRRMSDGPVQDTLV